MIKLMKENRISEALEVLSQAAEEKKSELASLVESKYASLKTLFDGVHEAAAGTSARVAEQGQEALSRGKEKVMSAVKKADGRVHKSPWGFVGAASAGFLLLGYWMGSRSQSTSGK